MIPDVSFPQESELVASWTQLAIWVQSALFLQGLQFYSDVVCARWVNQS